MSELNLDELEALKANYEHASELGNWKESAWAWGELVMAAMAALPELIAKARERKWHPIETVPNGIKQRRTRVLLFVPPYGAMSGQWCLPQEPEEGRFATNGSWFCHATVNREAQPTHWMPLPKAPTPNKEGE